MSEHPFRLSVDIADTFVGAVESDRRAGTFRL